MTEPAKQVAEHLRKGREAEDRALVYLEGNGLRCLERNFRTRFGEIDLVMVDRGTLVFVEVRYRADNAYGGALESIDRRKQERLIATAQCYLSSRQANSPVRFDVVGLRWQGPGRLDFVWIKDAIRDD